MIESKIYAQISDFVETNHRTKVHPHALLPYPWELTGSLASRYLFVAALPLRSTLFSAYFLCSRLTEGFSAIYLAPNTLRQSKPYKQQPPKYICINCGQ